MESDTKIIKAIKTKKQLSKLDKRIFLKLNNIRLDIYAGKTYISEYTMQAE